MPILLQDLFEETKNESAKLTKKQKKKLGRSNRYIKDTSMIPDLHCPEVGSKEHNRDIDIVKHYFENKSLSEKFLELSDNSCKEIFKSFCKDNGFNVNWKFLKEGLKDVNSIVFTLKQKYRRPRPKEVLKTESDIYKDIIDVDSYSFPSGHTTTAYFIASVLSDIFPEEAKSFKMLANLIGHSRIENCVHYPSDVIHGQFLGELLSDLYLDAIDKNKYKLSNFKIKREDEKILSERLRKISNDIYSQDNNPVKMLSHDMSDFIKNSCMHEGINIDYETCLKDTFDFISGYPIKSLKNKNVKNHLSLMVACNKAKSTNNVINLINIHKIFDKDCLEKGKPGMLRYFNHTSTYGNQYSDPKDIISHLQLIKHAKNPFLKHVLYEWIHPFCDGNGRSGRVILLIDTDFDFEKINNFCGKKYLKTIHNFVDTHKDIKNILL